MLLYDLTACQPVAGTLNHGGKEYAEAVFVRMMEMNIPLAGIYNASVDINPSFVEYCKSKGGILDVNETSVQTAINSKKYKAFYSPLPYFYNNIDFGDTVFIGNMHGLRNLEAFTDKYELLYASTLKRRIIAILKKFKIVKAYKYKKEIDRLSTILQNPSFVCLTGSEHSKYSMILYFPFMKNRKIGVFWDPLILLEPNDDVEKINEDYYLLVSGNRYVKNTYRGIMALDSLISKGLVNKKVVVTGVEKGQLYINKIRNKDHFILKGYVSAEELASLYKNAYSLVFLSLSEGFGYPPLEAISRGVPVVCSPLTAIYEVYQNGALYCDPLSVTDIETKILMMENEQIHDEYKRKGLARAEEIKKLQDVDLIKLVEYITSFS